MYKIRCSQVQWFAQIFFSELEAFFLYRSMLFKLDLAGSFLLSLVIIIVEASFDYKTSSISHINITCSKHFHQIYIT